MRVLDMQQKRRMTGAGLKARLALGLLGVLGVSAGAHATLNDAPYFNLFSTSTTYGGGSYKVTGDGTTVSLCGTATCGANDFAIFSVIQQQPAGSGYIDPFLRFQHNEQSGNGNSTTEAAYNTNNDALQTKTDGTPDFNFENQAKDTGAGGGQASGDFNHAIKFSTLLVEDGFITFKLDINEPGDTCNGNKDCVATNTLRLDELQFFISTTDQLSLYDPTWNGVGQSGNGSGNFASDPLGGGANTVKFWDMDYAKLSKVNGKNYGGLLLDNLNSSTGKAGSGDYDVQVKVPTTKALTDFLARPENAGKELYVYLYNFAGQADPSCPAGADAGCAEASAGFEEWAAVTSTNGGGGPPTGAPIPGTALLLGTGLLALVRSRKR